ncbi:uncharacterized protein STEHIDRAFT_144248 [Stereum hirsutum FP-91666 SS1]|uniref:uncharacterized protein n=1 Tax=Stereum hirsutum (strain FP-91666) TaxID=721885 RepID=UPI000440D8BB|nr:uncharacterized protein STEHIDRAFT_144248 [Stereum hirsutum FP-91666 SS1]EIM90632.1 hypothetical protein STEHIDRAFT_144248 [Stereum hirsutum FP-91666 SS1]
MLITVTEAAFYGIFVCLIIMSTYTLVSQGLRRSYARIALLVITLTMFAISTAHLILSTILYLIQWPEICATLAPDGYYAKIWHMSMAISVLSRAQYLISDAIVVWRAWAVWYDNRWVRGSLLFSLFGTAVTSIYLAVLNVLSDQTQGVRQYPALEQNMLGTFGLLFTNFSATIAIAVKAWLYRRSVKEFLNRGSSKTKVEGVLTLLVESGAVYCIYWVLNFISDFGKFGSFEFGWPQPNVSGIYPTLIILLVALQRSTPDSVFTNTSEFRKSLEPMHFREASPTRKSRRRPV